MKTTAKHTKEPVREKQFLRLFFVQSVLLLIFLFFCGKILTNNFSWRIFFCFLFLLCTCSIYGWAIIERKKGRINFFEYIIGFGFFVWFFIISIILTV
jgi:hypothetical protein